MKMFKEILNLNKIQTFPPRHVLASITCPTDIGSHIMWAAPSEIWFLSPMRAAKVQASLRIRAVSPEPSLLAHTSSESRGTFRQKARSLALLNGWAFAVKICHNRNLEDTNSLDGAHVLSFSGVHLTILWMDFTAIHLNKGKNGKES